MVFEKEARGGPSNTASAAAASSSSSTATASSSHHQPNRLDRNSSSSFRSRSKKFGQHVSGTSLYFFPARKRSDGTRNESENRFWVTRSPYQSFRFPFSPTLFYFFFIHFFLTFATSFSISFVMLNLIRVLHSPLT